jgi:hypothetical protein
MNAMFVNNNIVDTIPENTMYVINLKERTDRWNSIKALKLKRFNIVRFDAVRSPKGFGWVGCAMSHVNLVLMAKQKKMPYIIVAEDDFINTVHNDFFESRLYSILDWLSKSPQCDMWDVFNGLPTGLLVDTACGIFNRELGIINMVGGFNTHFIIYNHTSYDKVIEWYKIFDPTNLLSEKKMPDLSKNHASKNHMLAIDVFLSNRTNMITAIPLLTNSNFDDSDIVGNFTDTKILEVKNDAKKKLAELVDRVQNEFLINKLNYQRDLQIYLDSTKCPNNDTVITFKKNIEYFSNCDKYLKTDSIYIYYDNIIQERVDFNKDASIAHFKNNSQVVHHFVDSYNFLINCEKIYGDLLFDIDSDVTVIITSNRRWCYLYTTLTTFMKYNSYCVKNIIVVEDSGNIDIKNKIKQYFPQVQLLFDGQKKGQLTRIREAWALVDTKYVFHMEDDWEFCHPFFIEQSKILLEGNPELLNVWLRDIDDTNLHPILPELHNVKNLYYWKLTWNYATDWHGFTWNPTLMDYKYVYNEITNPHVFNSAEGIQAEVALSNRFKILNKKSAIIPGGFIRHIGEFSSSVIETKDFF